MSCVLCVRQISVQNSSRYAHAQLFVHMLIKSSNGGLTITCPKYETESKVSHWDVKLTLTSVGGYEVIFENVLRKIFT